MDALKPTEADVLERGRIANFYAVAEGRTVASEYLERFIGLAKRGEHRGASSGAKAARKLALAFLDDGLTLDGGAMCGLIDFMRGAKAAPETARDLIDG